jgi:hypothetical protein
MLNKKTIAMGMLFLLIYLAFAPFANGTFPHQQPSPG